MAKTKISEFSSTPGNNTDIDGINIAEGCAPSGINDAIRELMSQLKDFQTGAAGDSFNGPIGSVTPGAGAFTTLSASSTLTLSGGTANGVLYLNGSKVATSGSALTFDGTNLGIGTSNNNVFDQVGAARPLVVQKSDTSTTIAGSTASITISNSDTTTNNTAQLNFAAITGANTNQYSSAIISAIFGARTNGQYPTGQLVFSTSTSLNAAPTEKMRIDSSGNVGIGTSSPSYGLDIRKSTGGISWSTDPQWWVKRDSGAEFLVQPTSSLALVGTFSNHSIAITTNNTERMRIDSSGNVGIGTSSPSAKLQVVGNVMAGNGTAATPAYHFVGSSAIGMFTPDAGFSIAFSTGSTERMRIDSSGNLLFNSGYGSVATAYGCRAWCNVNGQGTTSTNQTINGSAGITSVYKNGSGDYTINFSFTFPDTNYIVVGSAGNSDNASRWFVPYSTKSTTAQAIKVFNGGNSIDNASIIYFAAFR